VDALIDDAITAMRVTSVTPMVSAAAVDAVRLGLRAAFSPASRAETPPTGPITRASSRLNGEAIVGPITRANDTRTITAPTPTMATGLGPVSARPRPISAPPTRTMSTPTTIRDRDRFERSIDTSPRAAIGGTRAERQAGAR